MKDPKFWAKYFKVYDTLNLLIPYQQLLQAVVDELDIQSGEKILEAGCGTGNLTLKIKAKGAHVVGIDNCPAALDVYKTKDSQADILLASLADRLPFEDGSFDKVAVNNVLYCFPSSKQRDILREIRRVLKDNGVVVIANPKKNWKPFKIYKEGVRQIFRDKGVKKGVLFISKLIVPTLKILYYNFYIIKESNYSFLNATEQKEMLEEVGFGSISDTKIVYAGEAILHSAHKV